MQILIENFLNCSKLVFHRKSSLEFPLTCSKYHCFNVVFYPILFYADQFMQLNRGSSSSRDSCNGGGQRALDHALRTLALLKEFPNVFGEISRIMFYESGEGYRPPFPHGYAAAFDK